MKLSALVVLAVGLAALCSCRGERPAPGGSGFIEATETVVSAETAGRLVTVDTLTAVLSLRQNQAVKREVEQQIAIAALRIEQSAQDLALARKEYDRVSKLITSGSVDQQSFDRTQTKYNQAMLSNKQAIAARESAQAELARVESERALLEKRYADCFPAAPVDGMVSEKYIETGEWVGVGRPLVKIARLDTVWVKVYLPPADLTHIQLGGRASIDPEDGRAEPLAGTVSWISPEAEFTPKNVQTREARADLVYAVKVTIPNPAGTLKVGMPVLVTIQ
jgi:HlyD family secretion protein